MNSVYFSRLIKYFIKGKNKHDKDQKDNNKRGLCRRYISVSDDKEESFWSCVSCHSNSVLMEAMHYFLVFYRPAREVTEYTHLEK